MNNILISAEEIAVLNERLRTEIACIRKQFEEIYDIKELLSSEDKERAAISRDKKTVEETCEIFSSFTEFVKNVCKEYESCENSVSEMVEAIRL